MFLIPYIACQGISVYLSMYTAEPTLCKGKGAKIVEKRKITNKKFGDFVEKP